MTGHSFENGAVLLPYEFDAATTLYGDIRSVVNHHDRSKSQCSSYLRALYDLRSGVVLHMAWIISKVMNRYVAAVGLPAEDFKPLGALRASLGGLDPVTDAVGYLDSALVENPELAEALYHKGLISPHLAITAQRSRFSKLRAAYFRRLYRASTIFSSRVAYFSIAADRLKRVNDLRKRVPATNARSNLCRFFQTRKRGSLRVCNVRENGERRRSISIAPWSIARSYPRFPNCPHRSTWGPEKFYIRRDFARTLAVDLGGTLAGLLAPIVAFAFSGRLTRSTLFQ